MIRTRSSVASDDGSELGRHIDLIERSYEYLLAYAAQGRQDERGSEARPMLEQLHAALGELGRAARTALAGAVAANPDVHAYLDAVDADARIARGAVALVLSRPAISSLLVDNLNASVHLRAVLTDAFLLDQARR